VSGEGADRDAALTGEALIGLDDAAAAFALAMSRGRLHHAWLITGPEGLGKAALAHRIARRLLGARPDPDGGVMASPPDDPATRLVLAHAHPDFIVLDRYDSDGKLRRGISVDEARRLPAFFAKAPALAPWRVAIIDAVDDLNTNAANAVLKILEEPPPRGVILLVSHSPGRLLPTIRSRCRRLPVRPWSDLDISRLLQARLGASEADAAGLAAMAGGSPGKALQLAGGDAGDADRAARDLLAALPAGDEARLIRLAEGFRGTEGAARFGLLLDRISDRIGGILRGPDPPPPAARRHWADVWSRLKALPDEVEGLNLDRADAFWSVLADLRSAALAFPLPPGAVGLTPGMDG
jgi:DNA polymerase-3 subunit delta'